jgi:hypothetical protein
MIFLGQNGNAQREFLWPQNANKHATFQKAGSQKGLFSMILGQNLRQTGYSCGFQRQKRLSPITFQ